MNYTIKHIHTKKDITALRNKSAFTFEGLTEEKIPHIIESLKTHGQLKEGSTIFMFTGKDMNKISKLTGDNAYQPEFPFVAIDLDSFNIPTQKLAGLKIVVNARWLDDIMDNNERIENKN